MHANDRIDIPLPPAAIHALRRLARKPVGLRLGPGRAGAWQVLRVLITHGMVSATWHPADMTLRAWITALGRARLRRHKETIRAPWVPPG